MSSTIAVLTICFVVFLWPVVVNEVSVNYAFILLPVVYGAFTGRLRRPPQVLLAAMTLFTAILALGFAAQLEFLPYAGRRLASFAAFMAIFAYTFVPVNDLLMAAFKRGVVAISVLFSLSSAYVFLHTDWTLQLEDAKNLVGSQRFGFIYLMAFWVTFLSSPSGRTGRVSRLLVLATIVIGLLLTFSRASIVGLLVPLAAYALVEGWESLWHPSTAALKRLAAGTLGAMLLFFTIQLFFPVTIGFFSERLFSVVTSPTLVEEQLSDPEMSPGVRIQIWRHIFEYVRDNPVTGAGYLGIWIIPAAKAGSAHNQYTDVLFRTGILGLAAYLYILYRVARYLRTRDSALYWGFVSVLVYGMFHETFKESQGGVVLAVLIGALAQAIRTSREPRVVPAVEPRLA